MTRITPTEEQDHRALAEWVAYSIPKYPDLCMALHVPNGGLRSKATAAKMKAMGQKKGVWDWLLLAPRGRFHGMALELKSPGGHLTIEQVRFGEDLRERGYYTAVCVGWDAARKVIEDYLRVRVGQ